MFLPIKAYVKFRVMTHDRHPTITIAHHEPKAQVSKKSADDKKLEKKEYAKNKS